MTQIKNEIVFLPTKAGNGFKAVHNGEWFYTSTKEVAKVIAGEAKAATLRTMNDLKVRQAEKREDVQADQTAEHPNPDAAYDAMRDEQGIKEYYAKTELTSAQEDLISEPGDER